MRHPRFPFAALASTLAVLTLLHQLKEDARLLRQGLPLPIRRVSPFLP